MLSESGFLDTLLLMLHFKYLPQPTLEIQLRPGQVIRALIPTTVTQ